MYLIDWVQEWAKVKTIDGYIGIGMTVAIFLILTISIIVNVVRK